MTPREDAVVVEGGTATPRPWTAITTGSEGCSVIAVSVRLPRVARLASGPFETCKADAALIVEAVNNLDRLRRVEAAARAFAARVDPKTDDVIAEFAALRDALSEPVA